MKNQHSRILAWLLVFSMVLAMMPAMLITASADEPASAATWAKTDLKDIKSTDTVAITMTRGEVTYALPTTIDAEKNVALALVCTVKDNTLTMSGTDAQYGWHISAAEGSDGYYITTGENYLSLANTAKGVVIGKDVKALWTVNEHGYLNADIVLTDKTVNRMLGVYVPTKEDQTPDWRCYSASSGVPSNIKDETLNFWVLGGTGSVPTPNPDPKPEPDPRPKPAAGEAAQLTELHSGDQVYICNPASSEKAKSRVMSGLGEDGKQFTSVEAEITDGVLSVTAEMLALTVTVDSDGNYTFQDENGNYLTVNGKNDMSLESAPSEASTWTLEAAKDKEGNEIAGSFLVKNAAVFEEKNLYLENYKGNFTSYIFQSWSRPMYTMQFFSAVFDQQVTSIRQSINRAAHTIGIRDVFQHPKPVQNQIFYDLIMGQYYGFGQSQPRQKTLIAFGNRFPFQFGLCIYCLRRIHTSGADSDYDSFKFFQFFCQPDFLKKPVLRRHMSARQKNHVCRLYHVTTLILSTPVQNLKRGKKKSFLRKRFLNRRRKSICHLISIGI